MIVPQDSGINLEDKNNINPVLNQFSKWSANISDTIDTSAGIVTSLCSNVIITAPALADQTYDLLNPTTSTSYTIPAFTAGSNTILSYSDASTNLPAGVIFDSASRTYSWAGFAKN